MKDFQIKEIGAEYDPTSLSQNVPFTQAPFYGSWQEGLGRKVRRFVVTKDGKDIAYFQLIKYPLIKNRSYLYIPYGPVVKEYSKELLQYIKESVRKVTTEENAVFARLDFHPLVKTEILSGIFSKSKEYTYHSAYFQPRLEWRMDLSGSEEELLMSLKKKTRYAVRLAEREKVEIEIVTKDFEKYFDLFFGLMEETSDRNSFSLHPKEYYQSIFKDLHKSDSFLVIARFNERVLAINLIIVYSGVANYVFGSSRDEEREKMPTYLAQWKGFLKAKELGCKYYNFGGICEDGDKKSSWAKLTLFKKKFPGEEYRHSEFFDAVKSPFWYHLYNFRKFLKSLGI